MSTVPSKAPNVEKNETRVKIRIMCRSVPSIFARGMLENSYFRSGADMRFFYFFFIIKNTLENYKIIN